MVILSCFSIPSSVSRIAPALALVAGLAVTALSGVAQAQEKTKESESAQIDVTPKGCPMKIGMSVSAAGLDIKHEPQAASFLNERQPARAPRMRSVWMFQTGVGFVAVMHAPHFDPVQGQLTQQVFDEIISGMRGEVAPAAKEAQAAKPQSGPNLVDHEIKADRAHFVLGKQNPFLHMIWMRKVDNCLISGLIEVPKGDDALALLKQVSEGIVLREMK